MPAEHDPRLRQNRALRYLEELRSAGWRVAVHNDYELRGELWTFWLFTHSSGRWVRGEARTDAEALDAAAFAAGVSERAARGEKPMPAEPKLDIAEMRRLLKLADQDSDWTVSGAGHGYVSIRVSDAESRALAMLRTAAEPLLSAYEENQKLKDYPHMCRDDHPEVGYRLSDEDERCPVCRERDRADVAERDAAMLRRLK